MEVWSFQKEPWGGGRIIDSVLTTTENFCGSKDIQVGGRMSFTEGALGKARTCRFIEGLFRVLWVGEDMHIRYIEGWSLQKELGAMGDVGTQTIGGLRVWEMQHYVRMVSTEMKVRGRIGS